MVSSFYILQHCNYPPTQYPNSHTNNTVQEYTAIHHTNNMNMFLSILAFAVRSPHQTHAPHLHTFLRKRTCLIRTGSFPPHPRYTDLHLCHRIQRHLRPHIHHRPLNRHHHPCKRLLCNWHLSAVPPNEPTSLWQDDR